MPRGWVPASSQETMAASPPLPSIGGMEHRHVRLERDGDIAVITLDNPTRRNALSRDMQNGLRALVGEVASTPQIRAVLLTATGNAFCAGADLAGNAIPEGQ